MGSAMDEEALRNVAADSMAQGFILELLLTRHVRSFPSETWEELARSIIQAGRNTAGFTGIAKTEHEAELLADVTVRMHRALATIVERSVQRAEAGLAASGVEGL